MRAAGAKYLAIVGPFYGGLGHRVHSDRFGIAGGRPIWTFWGGTACLLVAVGAAMWAVRILSAAKGALYGFVAASYVTSTIV